jgi:hypothetical protein
MDIVTRMSPGWDARIPTKEALSLPMNSRPGIAMRKRRRLVREAHPCSGLFRNAKTHFALTAALLDVDLMYPHSEI